MGIVTDDGTHELYLANVFLDGTSGVSYRGAGDTAQVAVTNDRDGRWLPGEWMWRSADDVVAYAVTCDCSSPDGHGATRTVLATWERVRRPDDEDLDLWGRLYVPVGQDAADASERPKVGAAMHRHWRQHLAPLQSTAKLQAAWAQHRQALAAVDTAVFQARQAGLSWVEVGRATGMTRQAARQRWGEQVTALAHAAGARTCAVCGEPITADQPQVEHALVGGRSLFEHAECCEDDR